MSMLWVVSRPSPCCIMKGSGSYVPGNCATVSIIKLLEKYGAMDSTSSSVSTVPTLPGIVSQAQSTPAIRPLPSNPQQGTERGNSIEKNLVIIHGGTFWMGDSTNIGEERSQELPVHKVTLDSFAMSKYNITHGEYCAFLNSAYPAHLKVVNGVVYDSGDSGNSVPYCDTSSAQGSNYKVGDNSYIGFLNNTFSVLSKGGKDMTSHPIVMVTWYGAVAYCNWRSQQEGKQICYNLSIFGWNCDFSKKGYRLPTEAEFEYAARGGLFSKRFPCGNTISHSQANYASISARSYDVSPTRGFHPTWNDGIDPLTSPIGSFPPNGYGLCDMEGNAGTWCNDWFGYYSPSSQINPTGPTAGKNRIMRGGSWRDNSGYCQVSTRMNADPLLQSDGLGFRVVLK
jgi:sulfatase modifying factor 1